MGIALSYQRKKKDIDKIKKLYKISNSRGTHWRTQAKKLVYINNRKTYIRLYSPKIQKLFKKISNRKIRYSKDTLAYRKCYKICPFLLDGEQWLSIGQL